MGLALNYLWPHVCPCFGYALDPGLYPTPKVPSNFISHKNSKESITVLICSFGTNPSNN